MLSRPPGEWGLPESEGDAGGQRCGIARGQADAMPSPQCHDPFVLKSNSLPLEIMNLLWILTWCEKSFEPQAPPFPLSPLPSFPTHVTSVPSIPPSQSPFQVQFRH